MLMVFDVSAYLKYRMHASGIAEQPSEQQDRAMLFKQFLVRAK